MLHFDYFSFFHTVTLTYSIYQLSLEMVEFYETLNVVEICITLKYFKFWNINKCVLICTSKNQSRNFKAMNKFKKTWKFEFERPASFKKYPRVLVGYTWTLWACVAA